MGYLMDWRSCRLSWGCRWLKSPRLLGIGSSSLTCRTVTWEAFRFVFKLSYVAYAIIQTELPASLFKIFDQLDMKALPLIYRTVSNRTRRTGVYATGILSCFDCVLLKHILDTWLDRSRLFFLVFTKVLVAEICVLKRRRC